MWLSKKRPVVVSKQQLIVQEHPQLELPALAARLPKLHRHASPARWEPMPMTRRAQLSESFSHPLIVLNDTALSHDRLHDENSVHRRRRSFWFGWG